VDSHYLVHNSEEVINWTYVIKENEGDGMWHYVHFAATNPAIL
jgi:hypothetical protein